MNERFNPTRRRWLIRGGVFVALLLLVIVLGSLNVSVLEPDHPSEMVLLYVFSTLVFLAFVGYGLTLIRYLLRLQAERRRGALGSKFKTRMVAGALLLSLLPAVALFFLSYALVNRTLAKWFPRPLEIVRDDALYMIAHVLEDHELGLRDVAQDHAPTIASALPGSGDGIGRLHATLGRIANDENLTWAGFSDAEDRLVTAHAGEGAVPETLSDATKMLGPPEAIAYTTTAEIGDRAFSIARSRVESADGRTVGNLILVRELDSTLLAKKAEIEAESRNYAAITQTRKTYRWQALLILLLVTTLVLLASTWLALFLAKEVTVPIQALAEATEEVSRGNFTHRVRTPARDELATLVDSFNSMTAQLDENRRAREEALAELDQRRRWMETLLESLPTGVLTLTPDMRLLQMNPAARELLNREPDQPLPLQEILPGEAGQRCEELLRDAERGGLVSAQLDLILPDRIAHLAVTAAGLRRSDRNQGYVLVLDDLSDLLKAQKAAAWQEVAQRIAHEIKNPLTPIQLSADRIRGYAESIGDKGGRPASGTVEKILQCAATIGQEVHSLKTLVNEFSEFARFPAARPAPLALNPLVENTLELYRHENSGINLRTELAASLPLIEADAELLRRVVSNLLQNAKEAMEERNRGSEAEILVATRFLPEQDAVELSVADNGQGIPPENKDGLFLPFFTTKANGAGLGLAVVHRIVADHRGRVRVEDNQPRGTRFVIELPVAPRPVSV